MDLTEHTQQKPSRKTAEKKNLMDAKERGKNGKTGGLDSPHTYDKANSVSHSDAGDREDARDQPSGRGARGGKQ